MIIKPLTSMLKVGVPLEWTEERDEIFKEMKIKLCSKPILTLYNPKCELEVHTDASILGLAGILMQRENSELKPVQYFSRNTMPEESNYPSYELEI